MLRKASKSVANNKNSLRYFIAGEHYRKLLFTNTTASKYINNWSNLDNKYLFQLLTTVTKELVALDSTVMFKILPIKNRALHQASGLLRSAAEYI